jgi:hypothetical protein
VPQSAGIVLGVPFHELRKGAVPDIDHIDHSVLMTTDIATTAAAYEAMGFTLSPLSRHMGSDRPDRPRVPMGAGNRCAYFGTSYLELLVVFFDDSRDPWHVRPLVEAHEGLRGVVLGCADCEAARSRMAADGLPVSGVFPLQRDVDTPDGVRTAQFRSVHLAGDWTPEGELLLGQQLTPELVHQARYLSHPSTATGVAGMLLVTADDEVDGHVARWARILGRSAPPAGGRHTFELGGSRIDLLPASALDAALPGESAPLLPFWAAQYVAVADLATARTVVTGNSLPVCELPDGFFVPARAAAGAAVVFLPSAPVNRADPVVTTTTGGGTLRGRWRREAAAFLGIPYAAPPTGPRRFAPPQPPEGWPGVRAATTAGAAAPQLPSRLERRGAAMAPDGRPRRDSKV